MDADIKRIFELFKIYKNDSNIFNKAISYIDSLDKNDVFDIIFINEICINLFDLETIELKKLLEKYTKSIEIDDDLAAEQKINQDEFNIFYKELIIFFNKINKIPEVIDFPMIYSNNQIISYDTVNLFSKKDLPNVSLIRLVTNDRRKIFLSCTEEQLKDFRDFINDAITKLSNNKG